MDKTEKKVRHQLLPSVTVKNRITDEDRRIFALSLDLLSYVDLSCKYDCSRAICDPLVNSDPELAETEQTLID